MVITLIHINQYNTDKQGWNKIEDVDKKCLLLVV